MNEKKEWLQELADTLARGQEPEPITTRDLLARFGAQRRGTNIVDTIRRELHASGLRTEPDIESAWLDQVLTFQRVEVEHAEDERPTSGWSRQLQQIASQLERGETVEPTSVRTLLRWFGAERRGSFVIRNIQEALEEFGLRTEPDFRFVYIDAEITFARNGVESTTAEEVPPASVPGSDQTPESETAPPAGKAPSQHPPPPSQAAPPPEAPPSPAITPPGTEDPTIRIGTVESANLASVNKTLLRLAPNDTIAQAVTLMMFHSISQLPVMQSDREIRGIVTWQSIGQFLALQLGTPEDQVHRCMSPPQSARADDSLLALLRALVDGGFLFIQDTKKQITGIVTTGDLSEHFHKITEPYLLLGEIENYVRMLVVRGGFTQAELNEIREEGDRRDMKQVTDLTLGQLLRLLQAPDNWARLRLSIDRKTFVGDLDEVRIIRNDVMHFRPDPIAAEKRETLRRFAGFLRDLRRVGAI